MQKVKMNNILVPIFVPLLLLVAMSPVTSAEDIIQVVSFRKARKMQNGPVMCALESPNITTSSSSLQECSLSSVRDASSIGFSIRNSHTCDLYNYKPKIFLPVSNCVFYQKISNDDINCLEYGNDATSIPSQCCVFPYTLNGQLYYNCTVNLNVSSDFGCYHTNGQWVKCQSPEDFVAKYEETSAAGLSANPAVAVPLLTISGWILMQRKVTGGSVSFDEYWAGYRDGFGSATDNDNYWLGLDKIYRMTQLGSLKLRIEIQRDTGLWYSAEYSTFFISDEAGKYQLTVDGYSGDAGNAMMTTANTKQTANGKMFTTTDSDNDICPCNCAYDDGWWFGWCSASNLNRNSNVIWSTQSTDSDVITSRLLVKIN